MECFSHIGTSPCSDLIPKLTSHITSFLDNVQDDRTMFRSGKSHEAASIDSSSAGVLASLGKIADRSGAGCGGTRKKPWAEKVKAMLLRLSSGIGVVLEAKLATMVPVS